MKFGTRNINFLVLIISYEYHAAKTYFVTYLRDPVLEILCFSWYFGRCSWFFRGLLRVFWGVFPVLGGVPDFLGVPGCSGVPVFLEVLHAISFSCQSKQLSRCCINFPHELTCQILTNQRIKIGRRAWPTRDHGMKRSSPPVFFKNWLNFRVRGQFEIEIFTARGRAPKLARKCESKHWFPCGEDGRSVVWSRDCQIFLDGYITTFP